VETRDATFFGTPRDWRRWLAAHHASSAELWVGFYKTTSGRPSITWPESVDEALCFGWIDGLRQSIDAERYRIRFTPRRKGSVWSAVNIRRVEALTAEGRMQPAGLAAFAARRENRSGLYSYEQRPITLDPPYEQLMKRNRAAWEFFNARAPSYRKAAIWWIVSAKKEETRLKRLNQLIEDSASGRLIRGFLVARKEKHE
jgi:uncharacterized protein YdeI (YjbR/CyaY-like superfamily)